MPLKQEKHMVGTPLLIRQSTAIHTPSARLLRSIPLRFIRKKATVKHSRSVSSELNLTSMIDYMIITVVFLLSNFSAQQSLGSQQGLEIPLATHASPLINGPVVSVNHTGVLINNRFVASLSDVQNSPDELPELVRQLHVAKQLHTASGQRFEGNIIFQVDRNIPWETIRRIATSCSRHEFTQINFVVTRTDER